MGDKNQLKIRLQIILLGILLTCIFIIATTPLHEAAHWIMSEVDPYSEPIEFHLFDKISRFDQNILSSTLGSVVIKESYPGSFKDRPLWIDPVQELICTLIQLILTIIIVSKILKFLIDRKLNIKKA